MDNFEMNNDISDSSTMKKHYRSFVKQLSNWYCEGKTPELASQDTRFIMELQKQKLESLGLDMQVQIKNTNDSDNNVFSLPYSDNVFTNYFLSQSKIITTIISNSEKEIYNEVAEGGVTIVMQNPKQGCVPPADTAMCCPHCGVTSTLGKLESGCESCGTKFLMDELYPKVMHVFLQKNPKLFDEKQRLKFMVGGALFFLVIFLVNSILSVFGLANGISIGIAYVVVYSIASIIIGALFGLGAWFMVNMFGSAVSMGKGLRGASKVGKSLWFCHKMRKLDPAFSTEYFRDKSTSLLKLMLYSQNPQELTICRCDKPIPEKFREILDTAYFNSGVDKYSIRDGICDVSLTFYNDSLHYKKGKIFNKSDKIRISMRKVIKKPTDLGFSITAVTCPSCAASFDAAKVRDCPFCGNTYPLEENDWVVTDID